MNYKEYALMKDLYIKTDKQKIFYTSYFLYINKKDKKFSAKELEKLLNEGGIYISNPSRIKSHLKESKDFKKVAKDEYTLTSSALKKFKENEISIIT